MSTITNMQEFLDEYGPAGLSQLVYILADKAHASGQITREARDSAYQNADDLKTALSCLRSDPRKQLRGVELRLQRRIADGSISPL